VDKNGKKISKADKAESITTNKPNEILFKALNFLGQKPDEKLKTYNVETILDWSIKNWDANSLPKEKEIIINPN